MAEFRCKAMQMSDQKVCRACNLVWDMNDPEPPACKGATNDFHVAHPPSERPSKAALGRLRETFGKYRRG